MPFRIDRRHGADIAVSIDDPIAAGDALSADDSWWDRLIGHLDDPPDGLDRLWGQAGRDRHHGGAGIDHLYDHGAEFDDAGDDPDGGGDADGLDTTDGAAAWEPL
jgi:hypothetical protein